MGDPARIANTLGVDVVADVRQADMAVGGEGAPLVPIYHAALARKIGKSGPIAFLNVGGVANFTFIGNDEQIIALDTGPGNGMLRSEEHTSELQSLMRISYAVFCLKKKTK